MQSLHVLHFNKVLHTRIIDNVRQVLMKGLLDTALHYYTVKLFHMPWEL